jgi:hypothetical protein
VGEHPVTKREINEAFDRMDEETKDLLRRIVYSDSPTKVREASVIVETFHYFRMDA